MDQSSESVRETFREATREDILRLAGQGGLTLDAQRALALELELRQITSAEIDGYREIVRRAKLRNDFGTNVFHVPYGFGIAFRGSTFKTEADRLQGIELRTRWILLFWIPLIPIGAYRVRIHSEGWSVFGNPTRDFELFSKEPLKNAPLVRLWLIVTLCLLVFFIVRETARALLV